MVNGKKVYNSSVNIGQRLLGKSSNRLKALNLNEHTDIPKIHINYFTNLMQEGGQKELTAYVAIEIAKKLEK